MARLLGLIALLLASCAFAAGGVATVAAQEATPAAGPDLAAFPTLAVTITASGFELPDSVPAGRYLVTATNSGDQETEASFVRLPADVTEATLEATLRALAAPGGAPDIGWVYRATLAGGAYDVPPGGQEQVIVDLSPGTWYVVAAEGLYAYQALTVTAGATPAATAPEPPADATIDLQEYAIVGLPEQTTPGRQVWKVTNTGTQPHFLELGRSATPLTAAQFLQGLQVFETGTPQAGAPDLSQGITDVPGMDTLSAGQTAWLVIDLEPGNYLAACFFADQQTGMPHALMGMVGVFTVGEGSGAPAGTPAA
jgi:hypothetical protein